MIRYPSVVTRDQDALVALLATHADRSVVCQGCASRWDDPKSNAVCTCCDLDQQILDVTCNKMRVWKGLPYSVLGMDIDAGVEPHWVGDFTDPGTWPAGDWKVVVFDPPHASELGAKSRLRKPFATAGVEDVSDLFYAFLDAFDRATPNALLLVKLANQMHRNKQRWQVDDFNEMCRLPKLDEVIRTRKAQGNDPKWKAVHCVRKVHSYWLAYRRAA